MRTSNGEYPVAGCGLEQYLISMYYMLELLDVPSLWAICSVLFSTVMKLSASPFALGCSGVTLWCSNPISSAYNLKYVKLNWGLLSDYIFFDIPCVANVFLRLSHATLHDVDVVCSTTGKRVLLSITN